jgi:ABC-type glycerol-3-phosphate transport system substrate-binding protein
MTRTWALALGLAGAASAAQAAKLTVWLVGDDTTVKILQPAVDAFVAKHPGTELEVRAVPWGDAMTKFSAAIASKTGPDVITGGLSYGVELGAKGGLVDLAKKAPDLMATVQKHGNQGLLKSVRGTDGTVYAVPFDISVQMQFWRTDLMPKAPTTWEEFSAEVARQVAGGNKGFAQQWGNMAWLGFFPYLAQAGGALYDEACTKSMLDSPAAATALAYYASLYTRFKIPSDTWPDADAGFESGTFPLMQTGSWVYSTLDMTRPKVAGKWGVTRLPAGPLGRSTAFLGGTVVGVTQFSPQQDLAVAFVKTLYEAPVAKAMMDTATANKVLWLPGGREDVIEQVNLPADRRKALVAQLKDAAGPPNCKGWLRSDAAVTRAIQQVVLAGADPKQALADAAARMNRNLAR